MRIRSFGENTCVPTGVRYVLRELRGRWPVSDSPLSATHAGSPRRAADYLHSPRHLRITTCRVMLRDYVDVQLSDTRFPLSETAADARWRHHRLARPARRNQARTSYAGGSPPRGPTGI